MPDPFDTARLRQRVLAAWAEAPARFREDANAEEDLVLGGYRDRLIVELAQNAADAALRAGGPGHLRLELVAEPDGGHVLRAANTGAPLDAAGVEALATLRASAKRDQTGSVGRFGVGFAAVLTAADEPSIRSTSGGVRFSAAGTREEVAALPALAEELARRDGAVPVLRLPWPVDGMPPEGFDTEVVLPLRPGGHGAVRAALEQVTGELLLALPGLAAVDVVVDGSLRALRRELSPPRVRIRDGAATTTWQLAQRSGELATDLVAGRPVEERERRAWTVTWAVPVDDGGRPVPLPGRQVVHAPTPSEEPLSLPVRLIAPFPLAPDRRHVLPGPVTDALVEAAAATYADLVQAVAGGPAVLTLVPRVGLAAAELDAALGAAVLAALRAAAWLPEAGREGERQPPPRAAVLDDAPEGRVAALTGVLPGLLPPDWSRRADAPALRALSVRRIGLAEAVEAVRGVDRPAAWWAALYTSLEGADREELSALPVPLADGRTAHGPAGVLLPAPGLPVERLAVLGLRLAAPEAAAPAVARRLLERLGARPATAREVLADPAVVALVAESMDAVDDALTDDALTDDALADDGPTGDPSSDGPGPAALVEAVLALVAAVRPAPGEFPWLAELALPDADGGWAPAGELMLPGSRLAAVLAEGSLGMLHEATARRVERSVLRAVGVLETFALVRAENPEDLEVDGVPAWIDAVDDRLPPGPPPSWPPVTAVSDLECVVDWPAALLLLADLPAAAWADVVLDGVAVPGYLRWWLCTHPVLDGERPDRLRAPGASSLQGLYAPAVAESRLLSLLRPPSTVDDVVADLGGAVDLLDRLGDPGRTVRPSVLATVYAQLAVALDGADVDPPARVRVAADRVSSTAVVLDVPYLQPLVDRPVVPAGGAPGPVADLLDLPLASELVHGSAGGSPQRRLRWADVPGAGLAAARLGLDELGGEVEVHDGLSVSGRPVRWWPGDEGPDLVDGSPGALGRALAWRAEAWPLRHALAEAFAFPDRAEELWAEDSVGS